MIPNICCQEADDTLNCSVDWVLNSAISCCRSCQYTAILSFWQGGCFWTAVSSSLSYASCCRKACFLPWDSWLGSALFLSPKCLCSRLLLCIWYRFVGSEARSQSGHNRASKSFEKSKKMLSLNWKELMLNVSFRGTTEIQVFIFVVEFHSVCFFWYWKPGLISCTLSFLKHLPRLVFFL